MSELLSEDQLGAYRWSLAEYVLRCETGEDIREVVTEGELDAALVQDALSRWKASGVAVLDAQYIRVTAEEIAAAGFTPGVKGALSTIAHALDTGSRESGIAGTVVVVVDRDYDDGDPTEHLALTDGYSVESYSCSATAIERFVSLVLGRGSLASGAGGRSPARRTTCSGADLLERIEPPAVSIAAVRLTLRVLEPPPGLFDSWSDYVTVATDGTMTISDERLLRNVLTPGGHEGRADPLVAELDDVRRLVAADPFRLVRGRDRVTLLLKLLRSSWGRRIAGTRFRQMSERELVRLLFACIDPAELDGYLLFQRLRQTFA